MRTPIFATTALAALVALAAFATPRAADADAPNYDVAVAGTKVTVHCHKGWHVNKEYPWKLTVGATKLDKSKFTFGPGDEPQEISVSGAPTGSGTLKGAICSGPSCLPFEAPVTIK